MDSAGACTRRSARHFGRRCAGYIDHWLASPVRGGSSLRRQLMETIKCPVCGEVNPANAEFCQNCMSRLQPLTGPLRGENAPIQPGQNPTKKVTAELEPILPQWLREAREKARQSAKEDPTDPSFSAQEPTPAAASTPDLLAGL